MKIYNIYGAIICAALSLSVACDHPRDDYDLPQSDTVEGDKSTLKINCGDSSYQFSDSDMIGVTVIEESKQPTGHSDGLWRQLMWAQPYSSPGIIDGNPVSVDSNYNYAHGDLKTGLSSFYGKGNSDTTR